MAKKTMRLGQGGRFQAGVKALMRDEGMDKEHASAIMAARGRAKYGAAKMAKWSAAGRRTAKS